MEATELDLIHRLSQNHDELRHLFARHQGFEKELSRLESVRHPSESERREIAKLKRQKLAGKDRIRRILAASAQG